MDSNSTVGTMKICKVEGCNQECDKGRRYCHRHFLENKAKQYREKKAKGIKCRTTWESFCEVCGSSFQTTHKDGAKFCKECYAKIQNDGFEANNNYEYDKSGQVLHRVIAEEVLGRKLEYNEVLHHLDGNSKNNNLENLMLLSRSNHSSLHRFLSVECVKNQHKGDETFLNWKSNMRNVTLEWLDSNEKTYKILSNK